MSKRPPFVPPYGPVQSPKSSFDLSQVAAQIQQVKAAQQQPVFKRVEDAAVVPLNDQKPYATLAYNLADSEIQNSVAGFGRNISQPGFWIRMPRRFNHPGVSFEIRFGSDGPEYLSPGTTIHGFFKEFQLKLSSVSATTGTAYVEIGITPEFSFSESTQPPAGPQFSPIALLGSGSTFSTLDSVTRPTGATPTGYFSPQGFSEILVLFDADEAGSQLLSTTVTPYQRHPSTGNWHAFSEDQVALAALGDGITPAGSGAGANRYRAFLMPVRFPTWLMCLFPRPTNPTPFTPGNFKGQVWGVSP